jgi:hypothetical protein
LLFLLYLLSFVAYFAGGCNAKVQRRFMVLPGHWVLHGLDSAGGPPAGEGFTVFEVEHRRAAKGRGEAPRSGGCGDTAAQVCGAVLGTEPFDRVGAGGQGDVKSSRPRLVDYVL